MAVARIYKTNHLVTACLQLGTNACRIGFLYVSDFEIDPSRVNSFHCKSSRYLTFDFPSAMFFAEKVCFGYEACEEHTDNKNGVFIDNVLKRLYSLEEIQPESMIQDLNGRNRNASMVMKSFLNEVQRWFMANIKKAYVTPSEIKFIVTIPSIRAGKMKAFVQEAWRMAFNGDDVTVITFPDAVLTYYLHVDLPIATQCRDIEIGERVMVVGFEDEIDSFTTYEKRDTLEYKQVTHHISSGSTKETIVQSFDTFFRDLFGSWLWSVTKENDENMWSDIKNRIDICLRRNLQSNQKVTFSSCFIGLEEICIKHTNMTLKEVIERSEYSNEIVFVGSGLRIPSPIVQSIFDKGIMNAIRNITKVISVEEKDVKMILLAGNLAECPVIKETISEKFPQANVVAGRSVHTALEGGTMYGFKPPVISSLFSGAQKLVS